MIPCQFSFYPFQSLFRYRIFHCCLPKIAGLFQPIKQLSLRFACPALLNKKSGFCLTDPAVYTEVPLKLYSLIPMIISFFINVSATSCVICTSFVHNQAINSVIFQKGNVHAAAPNIPFSWLIFPLSANLQHLCLENNRFFRCLPTSDTFVRKTYQILGVNPPLIHSFSNYIPHKNTKNAIPILSYNNTSDFIRIFTHFRHK